MKIACLGWGSLIWNPAELNIQKEWFQDGPILPIEFTRVSDNKRVTLIVDASAGTQIRTLWALMLINNLDDARQSLMHREGAKDIKAIHHVEATENSSGKIQSEIVNWLRFKQLDAAIWTGLSYNQKYFDGTRPSVQQIMNHLDGLRGEERNTAEYYIRKAPKQIDTIYRKEIEKRFGWTPVD